MSGLAGKRILVTRPRAQAADLIERLTAHGAIPILFPTIEIAPLPDYTLLDKAIGELATYQWIIFTSVNGVAAFWKRLELTGSVNDGVASNADLTDSANIRSAKSTAENLVGLKSCQVAAIGPATAQALARRGVTTTFVPEEYIAEAIVGGLGDVRGQRILVPRAELAREALAVELTRRGAFVNEIAAYRTLPAVPDPQGRAELQRGVDAITFTSSSTVRNFVQFLADDRLPDQPVIACLGPITAQTARDLGLAVTMTATEYNLDGLVAALEAYYAQS